MAFQHEQFFYSMGQPQQSVVHHPDLQYSTFPQQSIYNDLILNGYPTYTDRYDILPAGAYMEEYDEGQEVTTRPRLTKEQVEVLENEFLKNCKPSSMLKRQLAAHTSLSLNRVANWFQNRRAKAKQQRKLEEYEKEQQSEQAARSRTGTSQSNREDDEGEDEADNKGENEQPHPIRSGTSSVAPEFRTANPYGAPAGTDLDDVRAKAYASLQRALSAAQAARPLTNDCLQNPRSSEQVAELPLSDSYQQSSLNTGSSSEPQISTRPQVQHCQDAWNTRQGSQNIWPPSPHTTPDISFDFGFTSSHNQPQHDYTSLPSPTDSGSKAGMLSPETWEDPMLTPTMPTQHHELQAPMHSPALLTSAYCGSRRGSAADALTNNFEGFAITSGTSQTGSSTPTSCSTGNVDGTINLASRRNRPRPAPINSASLRSRSYGALAAASPTSRQGMYSSPVQTLRHVKSTGHSLNNHYSGIRKPSAAQKSPLNVSTFAESEFQNLMAQKAAEDSLRQQLTSSNPLHMNHSTVHSQPPVSQPQATQGDMHSTRGRFLQSPPVTPFQTNFLPTSCMMPQSQFASFPDYTPPYSAGPLTSSSWSDAPLISPDVTNFPQPHSFPVMISDLNTEEHGQVPWMFSSDQSPNLALRASANDKQRQFHNVEFPGQKEEHAQAAQQLSQSRPKHYAFQHHKPEDFISS
ncbi:hypothetical protein LTR05_001767 [Lithohypha guttulata]|uniref:Homeobox domain-containing protein n=1 Tax=Lithohypha guttulata TaxID=1690604 RepID=A0AAN7T7Z1_9EURO|nr:hypothetical protein LTR05_001767 [Lithohypha guttulata]